MTEEQAMDKELDELLAKPDTSFQFQQLQINLKQHFIMMRVQAE